MMRLLIEFPRWLFLGILVFAPWARGCIPEWSIWVLNLASGGILVLWLLGCAARGTKPKIGLIPLAGVGFLLCQGWGMILNAHYAYDRSNLAFRPLASGWKMAPGSVDIVDSIPIMVRLSGVLGIFCFVCDLMQRPHWRRRVGWTMGATGISIVLYGLGERIAGVQRWSAGGEQIDTFFSTYLYNANAGAFINLVLPLVVGSAVVALTLKTGHLARVVWVPGAFLCVAGAIAAASKAAMAVTCFLLASLAAWGMVRVFRKRTAGYGKTLLLTGIGGAVLIAGVSAIGWDTALGRWSAKAMQGSAEVRWLAYGACMRMLPDTGAWGFGAGNFGIAFPHYTGYLGNRVAGQWLFAHEDYLQTLIEWGWVGTAVWGILFLGGIIIGTRNRLAHFRKMPDWDRMLVFTSVLALIGVALHALVDFPLQIASLQLYTATCLGTVWGSSYWTKNV